MCEPIGLLSQSAVADGLTHHAAIPRWAITPRDCRASFGPVKPLRFAPTTPVGAGGLDEPSGPPRMRTYVMAGMHPSTGASSR